MALNEHVGVERDAEAVTELQDSFRLMLAATIGKEDEGNAVRVEIGQSFLGPG